MKAVVCQDARLEVAEIEEPTPAKGQILLDVVRCGICGSDLHARHHADELAGVVTELGYDDIMRADQRIVLGHEFSGIVADHGPGSKRKTPAGTPVVAMPLLRRGRAVHTIGFSIEAPGAYAEQLVALDVLEREFAASPGRP